MITDHIARPGPSYWDFKCLQCDGLVRDHASAISQLLARPLQLLKK